MQPNGPGSGVCSFIMSNVMSCKCMQFCNAKCSETALGRGLREAQRSSPETPLPGKTVATVFPGGPPAGEDRLGRLKGGGLAGGGVVGGGDCNSAYKTNAFLMVLKLQRSSIIGHVCISNPTNSLSLDACAAKLRFIANPAHTRESPLDQKAYNACVKSTILQDSRGRFEGRRGSRTPPRLSRGAPRKVTCSSECLIFLAEFDDCHVP